MGGISAESEEAFVLRKKGRVMTHGTKTSATSLSLILDPKREWQERMRMIWDAQQFLYVSTYYIEYDPYGIEFLDGLIAACERRVHVVLLIDSFGQWLSGNLMTKPDKKALREKLDILHARGCRIVYFRPRKLFQRLLGTGFHSKYQLSEQGSVIFGSGNISKMSFDRWFEFALMVRGLVVGEMVDEFVKGLGQPGIDEEANVAAIKGRAIDEKGDQIPIEFLTHDPAADPSLLSPIYQQHDNRITRRLIADIDFAQESILLTSFYYKPPTELAQAIIRAARRGVHVEIHHSHRDALGGASAIPWIASSTKYPSLLRENVRIYEHLRGQHTKFLLVDSRYVWLGSYNFEFAADDRLIEAMVGTSEPTLLSEVAAFFEHLRQDDATRAVTAGDLASLSPGLRAYRLACLPFRRWL